MTYILQCSKCGKGEERSYNMKKCTCFSCKQKYNVKYQRNKREEKKEFTFNNEEKNVII